MYRIVCDCASFCCTKMSWRRPKSPGWAAFDHKQQQKQGTELEAQKEPYPPISSNIAPLLTCHNLAKNDDLSMRSFSSVLTPVQFPNIIVNRDTDGLLQVSNSNVDPGKVIGKNKENNVLQSYKKLKELHVWADENLIEEIMAAVENDVEKASNLLEEMVSPVNLEEKKEMKFEDLDHNIDEVLFDGSSLPENVGPHVGDYDDLCMKSIIDNLRFMPVEPEWEEDDIYLKHRKEAIRMMRSASRHSKSANDAYLRGDYLSAQEFSLKARKEWSTVEQLNAKAVKEILTVRNCNNDEWKLDLHGLHAAEAVQVLLEHLQKIECQGSSNRSANFTRDSLTTGFTDAASLEPLSCVEMRKSDKQQQISRRTPILLEVITGRGSHSRGQAALPTAVRNFLSENGYHYFEARAGVISVQPKFRHL